MNQIKRIVAVLFLAGLPGLFAGCAEAPGEEEALQLPPREHTWVRKETVKKTKDEFFSGQKKILPEIAVNETLAGQLTKVRKSSGTTTDSASCLAQTTSLDNRRTEVQKSGGMWHAFERLPDARPYTSNGMQLDSRINAMVFALGHLCRTAKGVPMDELARRISQKVEARGKEAVRKELTELGNSPAYVDKWLRHAEFAEKNVQRVVEFSTIGDLIARAEPLLDVYEELAQRQVGQDSIGMFLSDAVTLLKILQEFLSSEPNMVMALKEDIELPKEESGEM